MDIHIDLEQIGFFISLVVIGVASNWYYYNKGLKKGWDNLAFELESELLIEINDDGEIKRLSDKEFQKRKLQYNFEE